MTQAHSEAPRVLIIRLSALGDILHALPVLATLRRRHPGAHIGWLVQDVGAPLIEGHPLLNRIHVLPRRAMKTMSFREKCRALMTLRSEILRERYDTTLDLQGLAKSAIWGLLSKAPRRIGFKGEDAREFSSLLSNHLIAPATNARHVVQKNLALLSAMGIHSAEIEFPVHLNASAMARARQIWGRDDLPEQDIAAPCVIINPGAGWATKQWPPEHYGRLAAMLVAKFGARVALSWGPGEQKLVRATLQAIGREADFDAPSIPPEPGVYALPRTSFVELGAVVALASLLVAGDTGPLHFAAALGIPTVGIFGASDPVRNGPWGERSRFVQNNSPACIPCWKTKCAWREPFACLEHLSVERVITECEALLSDHA